MSSKLKHHKKKNVGLIHEFLLRKMASSVVSSDREGCRVACSIFSRRFPPGSALAKERELFDAIVGTRGASESVARGILNEVAAAARGPHSFLLDAERSELISEVDSRLGRGFYSEFRLPEYRLLASVQLFIDSARGRNTLSEGIHAVRIQDGLVSYMMSSLAPAEPVEDRRVDALACEIAVQKMSQKYSGLGPRAVSLLGTYVRSMLSEDVAPLREHARTDRQEVADELAAFALSPEAKGDPEMAGRLAEARGIVESLDVDSAPAEQMLELLNYWKLVEEIRSDV